MHYCPSCGYEYEQEVDDCPDCHTELITEDLTTCLHCGENTRDHQIFCDHCGNFVNDARKLQFTLRTQERDITGACVICGVWIHEGTGEQDGYRWFCDRDDHYQVYEDWVVLLTLNAEFEAGMYQTQLESAGIPVQLLNQKDSSYITSSGDLSLLKIMVPKDRLADASELLTHIREDQSPND